MLGPVQGSLEKMLNKTYNKSGGELSTRNTENTVLLTERKGKRNPKAQSESRYQDNSCAIDMVNKQAR